MKLFIIVSMLFSSFLSHAHQNQVNDNKPYVVLLSSNALNHLRVNIENYKPDNKAVKKYEINFGDGVKVANKKDIIHKYLANGTFNLVVKTWDNKNKLTTYTQSIDINTAYQVKDIPNSRILGPVSLQNRKKYKLDVTAAQSLKLFKVIVFRNTEQNWPFKINKFCKRDYNVEVNDIQIFQEDEINCHTTQVEKFAWLSTANVIKFEAEESRWRKSFKVQISAVEIIKNIDATAPVISSSLASSAITNNPKVHISIQDSSSTVTSIWNGSQELLGSTSDKEFDIDLSEGLNSFVLQSKDAANNTSPYFYLNNIKLDTAAPILNAVLASEYIYNSYPQSLVLNINSDEELQLLTVNNQLATLTAPNTYSFSLIVTQAGLLSLSLKAFDLAGNERIQTYNVIFGLDNIPPAINSSLATNSITNINSLQISISDNSDTFTEVYSSGTLIVSTSEKLINLTLSEGINNYVIKSKDQYGNESTNLVLSDIVLDTVLPSILSHNVQGQYFTAWFPDEMDLEFRFTEPLKELLIDGNLIQPVNGRYLFTKVINHAGQVPLVLKATDLAGNVRNRTFILNIILDNSPPQIFITGGIPTLTDQDYVFIPVSLFDASPTVTELIVNGETIATVNEKTFSYNVNLPTDGIYHIGVRSEDRAGNTTFITVTVTKKKDQIPPVIENNVQAVYQLTGLPSEVQIQFTSNEELKSFVINGQSMPVNGLSFNYVKQISSLSDNQINLSATDLFDNVSTQTISLNLQGDTEAPQITSNLESSYLFGGLPKTIDIQINSNEVLKTLTVDGQSVEASGQQFSFQKVVSQAGAIQISVVATDLFNNVTTKAFNFVVSVDNTAPVITLGELIVQSGQAGISLPISIVDDSDTMTEVFLNQSLIESYSDKSFTQEISISADGTYIILVKATDSFGLVSSKSVTYVRDTSPLSIRVESPGEIKNSQLTGVYIVSSKLIRKAYINNVEVPVNADLKSISYANVNWSNLPFTFIVKIEDQFGGMAEKKVQALVDLEGATNEVCPLE